MHMQSNKIMTGQVYRSVKEWICPTFSLSQGWKDSPVYIGDTFKILKFDVGDRIITDYPDDENRYPKALCDLQGGVSWDVEFFKEQISIGNLVLTLTDKELVLPEPKNNGTREECYWCGKKTEVLMGRSMWCTYCRK